MLARCEGHGPAKVVSLCHSGFDARAAGTVIGYSRAGRHESRRDYYDADVPMTLNTRVRIGEDLKSLLNGGGPRKVRSICAETFAMDSGHDSPFGGPDATAVFQRVAGEIVSGLSAHPAARSLVILAPCEFVFDQETLGTMVRNYLTENGELVRVLRGSPSRSVTVVIYGRMGAACDPEVFENLEVTFTPSPAAFLFGALPAKDPFVFPASWLSNVALEFGAPVVHAAASDSSGNVLPVTVRSESVVTLDGVYLNDCLNSAVSVAVLLGQTDRASAAGVTGHATMNDTAIVSCEEVSEAVPDRLHWIGVHNLVKIYWDEMDSQKAVERELTWATSFCRWIDKRAGTQCAQELEATLKRVHRETSGELHRAIARLLGDGDGVPGGSEAPGAIDSVTLKIAHEARASFERRRPHPHSPMLRQTTFETWDTREAIDAPAVWKTLNL